MAGHHRRQDPGPRAATGVGDRRRLRAAAVPDRRPLRTVRRHRHLGSRRRVDSRVPAGQRHRLARPGRADGPGPRMSPTGCHAPTSTPSSSTRWSSTSPDAAYLAEVMDNAMELLAPGGTLFIGDVRNHSLQNAFQTGIAVSTAAARRASDAAVIQPARPSTPCSANAELPVRPRSSSPWLTTMPRRPDSTSRSSVAPSDNELSRYRYDVTDAQGSRPGSVTGPAVPSWTGPRARTVRRAAGPAQR